MSSDQQRELAAMAEQLRAQSVVVLRDAHDLLDAARRALRAMRHDDDAMRQAHEHISQAMHRTREALAHATAAPTDRPTTEGA